MASELQGKTIAILAADGVEQVEREQPRQAVARRAAVAYAEIRFSTPMTLLSMASTQPPSVR
jgi:hypothetical protein